MAQKCAVLHIQKMAAPYIIIIYIDYRAFFYFDTNKKFSKSAGHSLVFLKKIIYLQQRSIGYF